MFPEAAFPTYASSVPLNAVDVDVAAAADEVAKLDEDTTAVDVSCPSSAFFRRKANVLRFTLGETGTNAMVRRSPDGELDANVEAALAAAAEEDEADGPACVAPP